MREIKEIGGSRGKTEGRFFTAPRMCPQGFGGSSPPFGTRNRQAGVLLSLLGQRGLQREYFERIAEPSSAGSVAVSFTSKLNIR